MRNLSSFFWNIFEQSKVGDAKFRMFCEFHLQRLINNNPGGIYDDLITALTTAYMGYYGALEDEATKIAIREGKTVAMNASREKIDGFISQQEGLIKSKWGKNSPEYQEFYPQGITGYTKAPLSGYDILIERYKNAVTAHTADFDAAFVTKATTYIGEFLTMRTAQINLMSVVSGTRTVSAKNREGLEKQVMKDLLIIASNNVGKPEVMKDYFDQSIIRPASKKIYSSKVAPRSTENVCIHTFDADEMVIISNKGQDKLKLGLCQDSLKPVDGGVTVDAGSSVTVRASDLGDIAYKYLNVTNDNPDLSGTYEVELE
jgi:hypothetical protein